LALVQFNVTEDIESISFVDPSGTGVFSTSDIVTATSTGNDGEKFAEFTFSAESQAPSAITIYAADMVNSKYKITHVNSAGDNLEHQVTGATFTNISGGLTYTSDLFL
jgi:hypothetical protein